MFRRMLRSTTGNVAVIAALSFVPLGVAIGIGAELSAVQAERSLMQAAADAVALSIARETSVAGSQQRDISALAQTQGVAQLGGFEQRATVTFTASRANDGALVVEGLAVRPSFFGDLLPPGGFRISVRSVAEAVDQQPLCVIGDDATVGGTAISGRNTSAIRAGRCLVHANSNFNLLNSATVQAGSVRVTGVATGTGFSPTADTGALRLTDPFGSRTIAPPVACASVPNGGAQHHASGTVRLTPGVHRTEYNMSGTAVLALDPGEHWFCSSIRMRGQSRIEGEDVALFMMGGTQLSARENTSVSLSGRRTGDWAGFVLVASRGTYANTEIASSNVDRLLGTVYLPMSRLIVSANGDVAENSQWSVVVARNINLSNAAQLVINSDYAGSPVPVPTGVGNRAGQGPSGVRLTE
jgi:Flp pilus assembly protein TadG